MGFRISNNLVGYSDSNVNLKATGATLIFRQVDSTKLFFPFRIRVYSSNASGVLTPPTISIGTNSSSYNNILLLQSLTGLTAAGTYIDYVPTFPMAPIASGTDIFVNVSIAATGTTLGARFAIFGDSI